MIHQEVKGNQYKSWSVLLVNHTDKNKHFIVLSVGISEIRAILERFFQIFHQIRGYMTKDQYLTYFVNKHLM